MRVCIFTTIPKGLYSGGRYLSLILAYALRRAGAEVTYVTNNLPLFDADFSTYEDSFPLTKIVSPRFEVPDDVSADWVIVIPTGSFDDTFYTAALAKAEAWQARVALLSFETPNWFNRISPYARSAMPTESWRQVVARGGAVITIAREGIEPARRFFGVDRKDLFFDYWHPAINDLAAGQARPNPDGQRRITAFVRTEDRHKGAHDLLALDPTLLAGQTLSLVFGRGVDRSYVEALSRHFGASGQARIELYDRISDLRKFDLLASSKMLLFPSYFEGYGYPPVEAGWMDVPTVAYDLPLLHETVADTAFYAPPGDTAAFGRGVEQLLAEPPAPGAVRDGMAVAVDTLSAGRAFIASLERAAERVGPICATPWPSSRVAHKVPVATARSRALVSAAAGDLQLENLRSHVEGTHVRILGTARGMGVRRRLRFDLSNSLIPDLTLTEAAEQGQAFDVEGYVNCWASDEAEQTCRIQLIEPGGIAAPKTTVPVRASPQLLLEREARFPLPALSQSKLRPGVLICLEAGELFGDPVLALSVAALSQSLHEVAVESALLLTGPMPQPLEIDLDFLPLVDRVVTDGGAAGEQIDSVLRAGGVVVVPARGPAPEGARLLQSLQLPERAEGLAVYGAKSWAKTDISAHVVLDLKMCSAARRSRIERLATNLLVVSGDIGAGVDPEALSGFLQELSACLPGLRVVALARLIPDPALLSGSLRHQVFPLAERVLERELTQALGVVWLQLGTSAPDPLLDALLGVHDSLHEAFDPSKADPEALSRAAADLASRVQDRLRNPLGARLLWLRGTDPGVEAPRYISANAAGRAPDVPAAAPRLSREDNLCFAAPRFDAMPALVSGWSQIDEKGSLLAKELGLVGFEVDDRSARAETRLEVLLRCDTAGTTYRLGLNGRTIADLTVTRAGVQAHSVVIGSNDWDHSHPVQYLSLRVTSGTPDAVAKTWLVAIGLSNSTPMPIVWDEIAPMADRHAPTVRMLPPEFSFRRDAMMAGARLSSGFAAPEPEGTWTNGPAASISFEDRMTSDGPLVLEFHCDPFVSALHPVQHVAISAGTTPLAQLELTPGVGPIGLVIPPEVLRRGLDTLFLDCPDAHSPIQAGVSDDRRALSVMLRRLRIIQDFGAPEPLDPSSWRVQGRRVSFVFEAGAGVLRVRGRGPAAGQALCLGPKVVLVPLNALSGERWEAWIWLSADQLRGEAHQLDLVRDHAAPAAATAAVEEIAFLPFQDRHASARQPVTLQMNLSSLAQAVQDAVFMGPRRELVCDAVDLAHDPASARCLSAGWSAPEEHFVWSDGGRAALDLRVGAPDRVTLAVLHSGAFLAPECPRQRQRVRLGAGPVIATLVRRVRQAATHALPLPARVVTAEPVVFEFEDCCSPRSLGLSADPRDLSMSFVSMHSEPLSITQAAPQCRWSAAARAAGMRLDSVGAHETHGTVLALRGDRDAPHGVRLTLVPDVVFHPVEHPDGGWQVLVLCPLAAHRQVQDLIACEVDTEASGGFADTYQICSFDWPDRQA